MNMVGRPAGSEKMPVLLLEYAAHIVVEARLYFCSDLWRPVLCAEYQVVSKASEGIAQDGLLRRFCRPAGAQISLTLASQGLAPLATDLGPDGAGQDRSRGFGDSRFGVRGREHDLPLSIGDSRIGVGSTCQHPSMTSHQELRAQVCNDRIRHLR